MISPWDKGVLKCISTPFFRKGVNTLSRYTKQDIINMIQDNIAVCEAIKEGKTDNIPYEFMGRKAFLAFKQGAQNEYGQIRGNIVYNPDRINE